MIQTKRPYTRPETSLTEAITHAVILGSLEKPGGSIDDFNFETREWTPDNTEEDF